MRLERDTAIANRSTLQPGIRFRGCSGRWKSGACLRRQTRSAASNSPGLRLPKREARLSARMASRCRSFQNVGCDGLDILNGAIGHDGSRKVNGIKHLGIGPIGVFMTQPLKAAELFGKEVVGVHG